MELTITPKAQQWFKQEFRLEPGKGIRFYGKVYGNTNVHEGFSVGLAVEAPENPLVQKEVAGFVYFIEEVDAWFFSEYDLLVDYDESLDEPSYTFQS